MNEAFLEALAVLHQKLDFLSTSALAQACAPLLAVVSARLNYVTVPHRWACESCTNADASRVTYWSPQTDLRNPAPDLNKPCAQTQNCHHLAIAMSLFCLYRR